jgi:hypothetical protein
MQTGAKTNVLCTKVHGKVIIFHSPFSKVLSYILGLQTVFWLRLKMTVFWDLCHVVSQKLAEVSPDNGGSKHLRNVR